MFSVEVIATEKIYSCARRPVDGPPLFFTGIAGIHLAGKKVWDLFSVPRGFCLEINLSFHAAGR